MRDLLLSRKCGSCENWTPHDPNYTKTERLEESPKPGKKGNCEAAHKPNTVILHGGIHFQNVEEVTDRRKQIASRPSKISPGVHQTNAQAECNVTVGVDGPYAYSPLG